MPSTQVRLSVPGPGRTVAGAAELWGSPVRRAVLLLEQGFTADPSSLFQEAFGPRDASLGTTDHNVRRRAAWALVNQWLLGRSFGTLPTEANLADAEAWFGSARSLAALVDPVLEDEVLGLLRTFTLDDQFRDLLPYILDYHGPGTRRSVMKDSSTKAARFAKRNGGIYYTPSDVAEYMVEQVLKGFESVEVPSLIDPACGTGVFLLAALRLLMARTGKSALQIVSSLYGIDVDPLAVELCAFVLTHECLNDSGKVSPSAIWHAIRMNLATEDALTLESMLSLNSTDALEVGASNREELRRTLLTGEKSPEKASPLPPRGQAGWYRSISDLFPEQAAGFSVLVANPPYSVLGDRHDTPALCRRFASVQGGAVTPSTNIYVLFVEMMWRFTRPEQSRAATVVPLSIAFSQRKEHVNLRQRIRQTPGRWQFSFFDRTPDALFGDDVKQRCAIVTRIAGGDSKTIIETGPLQRWTSRSRHRLFQNLVFIPLQSNAIDELIPKLGSVEEAHAYEVLRRSTSRLWTEFTDAGRYVSDMSSEHLSNKLRVFLAGTAYNWLTLYRDLGATHSLAAHPTGSPLHFIELATEEDANATFSILSSRIVYWLWRVEGDGFHVPLRFLERLPWSKESLGTVAWGRLGELGRSLWEGMQRYPVLSVNAGKRTVSFCPYGCRTELDQIDAVLLSASGLDPSLAKHIQQLIEGTIIVDPYDQGRIRRGLPWLGGNGGS